MLNYNDFWIPSAFEAWDGLKKSRGEQEPNLDLTSNLTIFVLLTFPTIQQVPYPFCITKTKAEHVGLCRKEGSKNKSPPAMDTVNAANIVRETVSGHGGDGVGLDKVSLFQP